MIDRPCLRILIVEDEFLVALHLGQLVRSLGHVVVATAADGAAALAAAFRHAPDAALCDLRLRHDEDGIPVAGRLARDRGAAVVVVSATPERAAELTGRSAPVACVAKPFTGQCIAHALAAVPTRT